MSLTIFNSPCKNCLYTKDRVVSGKRAKEIIAQTIEEGSYFICHVSSLNDSNNTMCHNYYKNHGHHCKKLTMFREWGGGKDIKGLVDFIPQPDIDS